MNLRHCAAAALLAVCLWQPAAAGDDEQLIWPRLVASMRLVDDEQPEVRRWAAYYARYPDSFRRMLARSQPFLWYIVEAVEQRNMPAEIALLPAIESGFDPHARSAQQAHGLWQFVPGTGRALGLQTTRDYDARRDLVASTQAALDYLQDLHGRFRDWHLALAAYNVGSARLASLLRSQNGAPDFWALDLPRETHEHVRRLMGVALLVEKPHEFGVALPPIENRNVTEMIVLDRPVNLRRAAQSAGIDEALIRAYNPGLQNTGNSTGKKVLMLPRTEATRMRAVLASGRFAPETKKVARGVVVHVVQPGDSLWQIARRYDVRVRDLTRHNGLADTSVIRPGRRLEVPVSS